ncbi:hypothetical protein K8R33_01855 [archaeon]|nr:hypothetical protein [archaeon]
MDKSPKNLVSIYLFSFVIVLVALYAVKSIKDIYLLSALLAILILLSLFYLNKGKKSISLEGKGLMRYSLLCHNCNWEWMSNVTEQKYSKKCPNCGHDSRIEVVAIRKVRKLPKKSNKKLTSYFKK